MYNSPRSVHVRRRMSPMPVARASHTGTSPSLPPSSARVTTMGSSSGSGELAEQFEQSRTTRTSRVTGSGEGEVEGGEGGGEAGGDVGGGEAEGGEGGGEGKAA